MSQWLDYYTETFDTVEINNTFYRLPEPRVFARWRRDTPEGFRVAVKASRYLTHMRKLRQPLRPVRRLLVRAAALESRLGPLLYQLPSDLRASLPRLREFLAALRRVGESVRSRRPHLPPFQHVIEFRHDSWYTDEVFQALTEHGVSLCVHDKAGSATPLAAVGPLVYVRFHGPTGVYQGQYTRRALSRWAAWLGERHREGRAVFAYFNNDPDAAAVVNALALRDLLSRER